MKKVKPKISESCQKDVMGCEWAYAMLPRADWGNILAVK
jgi:hypothetical protein